MLEFSATRAWHIRISLRHRKTAAKRDQIGGKTRPNWRQNEAKAAAEGTAWNYSRINQVVAEGPRRQGICYMFFPRGAEPEPALC